MHVTFLVGLIVPASYDEHRALVKNGNAASKHVWKAVKGAYCWWKPGNSDLVSCRRLFLVMWWLVLCCFSFSTREVEKLRKRRDLCERCMSLLSVGVVE